MKRVGHRLRYTFHRPLRRSVIALWLLGSATAVVSVPVAWLRLGPVDAIPYAIVGALLVTLAIGVWRQATAALIVSAVLLGAQCFAVVGRAWELSHGIDETKSRQLQGLGVDPTVAIWGNLIFSAVSIGLFAWAVSRWSKYRPKQSLGA